MALHSFKTQIKEGKIHVTADPANTLKSNMNRQATLRATRANSTGKGVIIVGGGAGAFHAVESMREVSCFAYWVGYQAFSGILRTATRDQLPFSPKRQTIPLTGKDDVYKTFLTVNEPPSLPQD